MAVTKYRPALIVLDVMLPKLDGFEVCRSLRIKGDQTPIIMLTARDEDIYKILGLELGADDYLTKPFTRIDRACQGDFAQERWQKTSGWKTASSR